MTFQVGAYYAPITSRNMMFITTILEIDEIEAGPIHPNSLCSGLNPLGAVFIINKKQPLQDKLSSV